jgi:hypothetical protein
VGRQQNHTSFEKLSKVLQFLSYSWPRDEPKPLVLMKEFRFSFNTGTLYIKPKIIEPDGTKSN